MREPSVHVPGDHAGMRPAMRRIGLWPAEHFADELRDMIGMMRVHRGEDRAEYGILRHMLVETGEEAVEHVGAARPVGEGRDVVLVGHVISPCG